MGTLKDIFGVIYDGKIIIEWENGKKKLSNYLASETIDLSSTNTITVSKTGGDWPKDSNGKNTIGADIVLVDMISQTNCTIKPNQMWTITPNDSVNAFTLTIAKTATFESSKPPKFNMFMSFINCIKSFFCNDTGQGTGDPDVTVTIGEPR
jgi:hypothetical protein